MRELPFVAVVAVVAVGVIVGCGVVSSELELEFEFVGFEFVEPPDPEPWVLEPEGFEESFSTEGPEPVLELTPGAGAIMVAGEAPGCRSGLGLGQG